MFICFRGFVVVLIIVFIPAIVEISAPPLIHQFVNLVTQCICYIAVYKQVRIFVPFKFTESTKIICSVLVYGRFKFDHLTLFSCGDIILPAPFME